MASVDEEVDKARRKMFGPWGEFEFHKMDEKIHRFPAGLGAITTSYPYYIVPRLVAIGPYHHDKEHLEKMEEVKKAAASHFCQIWDLEPNEAYKNVRSIVGDARGKYITDETIIEGMKDDAYFAAMMFHDACFLLLYMDAYNRSYGKKEDDVVNASLRRFLFSKRDSIDNDIMLLENQLPWQVVQVLIGSVNEEYKEKLMMVVGKFIADMGNTFKICEAVNPEPYVWWNDEENPPPHLLALLRCHKTKEKKTSDSDDGNRCLPHLLALLRCHKTELETPSNSDDGGRCLLRTPSTPQTGPSDSDDGGRCLPRTPSTPQTGPSDSDDGRRCLPRLLALLPCHKTENKEKETEVSSISAMSPMELEEIGIKLTASKTNALFSGIAFKKGRLLGELSLAPLSLSDARASCLVNMAAFEICTASRFGDDANKTAVCSYLALLALFMTRKEDVHKLRAMGILHGPQSNTEMLNFFKSVMKHLPDGGSNFTKIMVNIENYKVRRYIWIRLYKLVYNHYKTIIKVLSILGTLIAFYQRIASLNKKN